MFASVRQGRSEETEKDNLARDRAALRRKLRPGESYGLPGRPRLLFFIPFHLGEVPGELGVKGEKVVVVKVSGTRDIDPGILENLGRFAAEEEDAVLEDGGFTQVVRHKQDRHP